MKKILVIILIVLVCAFTGCEERAAEPNVPDSAEIAFSPLAQQREIVRFNEEEIPAAVYETEVYGNRLFLFEDREDAQDLRAGLQTADAVYDLGTVGMARDQDIAAEEILVNGRGLIRITGSLGANYALVSYFAVEQSVPRHILTVEGHAEEADPDGDGRTEILGFSGTASSATLYKITDEGTMEARLNDALGAVSITYTNDGRFEAYFTEYPNRPFFYRFDGERLHRAD